MVKRPIELNQCCEWVYGQNDYRGHQCTSTKNLMNRDGKLYCKRHDPVEVKARDDARRAKWQAEWDEREKRDAEEISRERRRDEMEKAFPLLVKVAEAVEASPACLFDEFEWAEVHQMAVTALAAARPKKEKTP